MINGSRLEPFRRLGSTVAAALAVVFGLVALDHGSAVALAEEKPIRLVTGAEPYPPFSGRDLPQGGFFTELLEKAFAKAGYEVEITFAESWEKAEQGTFRGEYDATYPYFENRDRKLKGFLFSDPIFHVDRRLFTRSSDSWDFDDENRRSSLDGRTLCRPAGYYVHDIKDFMEDGTITLKRPADTDTCFEMLLEGEVDAVTVNNHLGEHWIRNHKQGARIEEENRGLGRDSLRLMAHTSGPRAEEVLNTVRESLSRMRESGELSDLRAKHLDHFYGIGEEEDKQEGSERKPISVN